MIKMSIELTSLNPGMLMNPKTAEILETLYTGKRSTSLKGETPPHEAAAKKLYVNDDGQIGIPADNLFACLAEAGRMVKYDGRRSISTASSSLLAGLIEFENDFLPFNEGAEWKTSMMGGNLKQGANKTAVAIVRPRFPRWGLTFTMTIDDRFVKEKIIRQLFDVAGNFVGLGDFRPGCKGRWGRFKVAKWEVIERVRPEEEIALSTGGEEEAGDGAEAMATTRSKRSAKARELETVGASASGLSKDGGR